MDLPDETYDGISSNISMEEQYISAESIENEEETFVIETDPKKALEKLLALAKNEDYLERLQYIQRFSEVVNLIGDEIMTHLEEIISFIPKDKTDIKRAFLEQVTSLLTWLQNKEKQGYKMIVDVVLPFLFVLLNSSYYDVKEKAAEQLSTLAAILTQEDREKHLLPQILMLGHDFRNEANRAIIARMLNQMAPHFGRVITEKFIWAELRAMVEDSEARVRRESILYLPSTCKVISQQFFYDKLLPFYLRVCNDTDWDVREACVQIIYEISLICTEELTNVREVELTEAMLAFLKDHNSMVKLTAHESLGPFISTLQRLQVHPRLIEHYLTMGDKDSPISRLDTDDEMLQTCAFYFPGVALTLGQNGWVTLVPLFKKLVSSETKVKKPIAYALHEIANIIGGAQTERDLLPVLMKFLKDDEDDIKFGATQNLALFFKAFPSNRREILIDLLVDLLKDQIKWRFRELIAKQIGKFTLIFNPETNFRITAPISFKLCHDPIASVRQEAAKNIYALFRSLYRSGDDYKDSTIGSIKGFSKANKFTTRQSFVLMCRKLMKEPEIFQEYFMESFKLVAGDKTTDVRIAVAKCLQKLFKRKNELCVNLQIIEIVTMMKSDSSKDVRDLVEALEFGEVAVEKQEIDSILSESKEKVNGSATWLMKEKVEDLIDKSNRNLEFRDKSER